MVILDRWVRLKYPEQFSDTAEKQARQLVDEVLRRAGVFDEAENTGRSIEEVMDGREQAMWEQRIREYDTSLLDALGLSVPEFIEMNRLYGARVRGGRHRAEHLSDVVDKALVAFLEVDFEGGTFTDAVERALDATANESHPPNVVTIRKWLSELAGGPFTTIPAPRRGRPKKEK